MVKMNIANLRLTDNLTKSDYNSAENFALPYKNIRSRVNCFRET